MVALKDIILIWSVNLSEYRIIVERLLYLQMNWQHFAPFSIPLCLTTFNFRCKSFLLFNLLVFFDDQLIIIRVEYFWCHVVLNGCPTRYAPHRCPTELIPPGPRIESNLCRNVVILDLIFAGLYFFARYLSLKATIYCKRKFYPILCCTTATTYTRAGGSSVRASFMKRDSLYCTINCFIILGTKPSERSGASRGVLDTYLSTTTAFAQL